MRFEVPQTELTLRATSQRYPKSLRASYSLRSNVTPQVFPEAKNIPPQEEILNFPLERGVTERRGGSNRLGTLLFPYLAFSLLLTIQSVPVEANGSSDARLHTAVKSYALSQLDLPEEDVLIEITEPMPSAKNDLIYDEVRILPTKKTVRRGLQMIRCGLFFKSRLQHTILVKVVVKTFQNVVVSSSDIKRQQSLRPEDLKLDRRETTRLKRGFYLTVADAVGKQSKRWVRQDEILYSDLTETQPLIRRGSEIEIHFSRGALNIVLPGVARQDGRLGKPIAVKCRETRRVYNAQVLDSKTVLVDLL
jgi:flagella basal body P-ring formation protein FlgA